jgi:hypothetical protein
MGLELHEGGPANDKRQTDSLSIMRGIGAARLLSLIVVDDALPRRCSGDRRGKKKEEK